MILENITLNYLKWPLETNNTESPLKLDQTPIICLHGTGQTAHSWDEFSAYMSTRFYVYCIDLRGHGDSSWAKDGDYSAIAVASDLKQFIDHLNLPPAIIMGLSLGT